MKRLVTSIIKRVLDGYFGGFIYTDILGRNRRAALRTLLYYRRAALRTLLYKFFLSGFKNESKEYEKNELNRFKMNKENLKENTEAIVVKSFKALSTLTFSLPRISFIKRTEALHRTNL
jgi:hypothetical protein